MSSRFRARHDSDRAARRDGHRCTATAQNVYVYAVRYARGTTLARDAVLLSTAACVPVLMAVAAFAA